MRGLNAMEMSYNQTMMFECCETLMKGESSENYFDSDGETNNLVVDSSDSDSDQSDEDVLVTFQNNEEKDTCYTGKDGTTIWYSDPNPAHVAPRSITKIKSGVKPYARNAKTELECWKLFFSNEIIEEILQHTNVEINSKTFSENRTTRDHIVKETTMDELLAIFGLMYIAGLNNSTGYNLTDLWRSDGTGVDIFRMTMSLQRFNFLQGCLRFDDATTRVERNAKDNIAPVRSMFDKFVQNCHKAYSPSQFLTLDEKYIPFRGDCPFRRFMPNTSASYGIKMHALVDAKLYYTVNLEIHAGKQPEGPYSISYQPTEIVDRLVKPVSKTKRNVTFNNRFMSIPLATHLIDEHGLTSTGAVRKNKKQIPHSFVTVQGRGVSSSRFGFQKDLTLVSYMPKKSKLILLLSSFHHDRGFDLKSNDKLKPEIVTFYNSTRTGVEFVDKLGKMYDVRNYSKSWPILILYNMMNIAALNSFIVYRENNNNSKVRRCEFIRKLGLALLEEHLKIRKNKENLPRELRKRIFEQMGELLNDTPAGDTKPYKRCRDCPSARDRKTKYSCIECKKPICLQHVVAMCQNCSTLAID